MIQAFLSGGVLMWPLLVIALGVVWIAGRTGIRIARGAGPAEDVERSIHTLLFWGVMSLILGLLGTIIGVVLIADTARLAGEVAPGLLWGGLAVSLVTLLAGLTVFLFAAGLWMLLHEWHQRRLGSDPTA